MGYIKLFFKTDLGRTLGMCIMLNMVFFVLAYFSRTDKLTDLGYSLSFILLMLYFVYVYDRLTPHAYLLMGMVVVWAIRLGVHLFMRVIITGKDGRFDGMRESFINFGSFWMLQAVSVWIILLPTLLFLIQKPEKLSVYSYLGLVIFLIGFFIEAIADLQKITFSRDKTHAGEWIAKGLWYYSRHPNYFGEILVWVGIYLYTSLSLRTSWVQWGFGFLSPLYITTLLVFISGVPILERRADERWGDNPAYRLYKENTSVLVPWLKR